jgi:curved DNA-binding protein CbpA
MTKDYYRILGVLDDAEDIVIKAAYKALAQRYHPDKWAGDKDEATRRMSDINEAYGVLSDSVKRKEYDSTRDKNSYQADSGDHESETETDESNSSVENDWQNVLEFYPDLREITSSLNKISTELVFSYKLYMLSCKEFKRRAEIANTYEEQFLRKYFGENKKILMFAKSLILAGNKLAAKELNHAVMLLGNDLDAELVISKIKVKHKGEREPKKKEEEKNKNEFLIQQVKTFLKSKSPYDAVWMFKAMGYVVIEKGFFEPIFSITYDRVIHKLNKTEFVRFSENIAKKVLADIS